MSEKTIVLPSREDMLLSLIAVRDNGHYQQKFYPILLQDAGQRLCAQGIVMMFAIAIFDYTQGMPPVLADIVYMDVPKFIDAIVDDQEVAKEAKNFLAKALS